MAQYIDKDAVVTKLEELYDLEYNNTSNISCGKKIMLRNILHFLDTLEVKEINLEKEFYDFLDTLTGKDNGHLSEDELFRIAEYFFELGLSVNNPIDAAVEMIVWLKENEKL